ncbi:MAG: hypothetical protein ACK4RZ_03835 [Paracoccaceae bacterium]
MKRAILTSPAALAVGKDGKRALANSSAHAPTTSTFLRQTVERVARSTTTCHGRMQKPDATTLQWNGLRFDSVSKRGVASRAI